MFVSFVVSALLYQRPTRSRHLLSEPPRISTNSVLPYSLFLVDNVDQGHHNVFAAIRKMIVKEYTHHKC